MKLIQGGTTVICYGDLYPLKIAWRRKQNSVTMETLAHHVFDRGVMEQFIELALADSHTNHDNIRDFIINTVNYRAETFTLEPDVDVDFGEGDGGDQSQVTVRFWQSNFIEQMISFQHYRYRMIFRVEN